MFDNQNVRDKSLIAFEAFLDWCDSETLIRVANRYHDEAERVRTNSLPHFEYKQTQ